MAEQSYERAVQVLQSRMGGRWEGAETDGRDEMVRILKDELGFDDDAAHDALDAMVASGTLRYHRAVGQTDEGIAIPAVSTGTGGAGTGVAGSGLVATPGVPPAALGGYWAIGPEEQASGRTGQVNVAGT